MPVIFCKDTDIRRIIELMPVDEAEHMRRVGALVGAMAEKMSGLDPKDPYGDAYKYFGEAAAYHDIGKAWVPQHLLTKPGKLTEEEAAIIYKHPVYARKIFDRIYDGTISGIPKHLRGLALESAVYHHEWWNGKGYPHGTEGEDIPLIARVTSICDVYDAITSDRTYSRARSHYHACRELEANAGIQFDPALVRIFLEYSKEFLELVK